MPIADRPMLGILLMTGFCVLAPLGDSIAKILGDTIPLAQLLFVRFAMQASHVKNKVDKKAASAKAEQEQAMMLKEAVN